MKTMVTALIITLCSSWTLFSQDFHPGPYGTAFFDIAGPFTVQDLNATVDGDVNLDEIVNIQDIIIIINAIMGNIELTGDQIESADVNSDGNLDILDVVGIVNLILYPQAAGWDFESHWNGEESYIFIHLSPTVGSSSALWNSNTKLQLLENSPSNVHYFLYQIRTLLQVMFRRWRIASTLFWQECHLNYKITGILTCISFLSDP